MCPSHMQFTAQLAELPVLCPQSFLQPHHWANCIRWLPAFLFWAMDLQNGVCRQLWATEPHSSAFKPGWEWSPVMCPTLGLEHSACSLDTWHFLDTLNHSVSPAASLQLSWGLEVAHRLPFTPWGCAPCSCSGDGSIILSPTTAKMIPANLC